MDPIQLPDTTHNYSGVNVGAGANTIDGDQDTYAGFSGTDSASGSGGSFAGGGTIISEHVFATPQTIFGLIAKLYASVSSTSSTDNAHYYNYALQYQLEGSGVWTTFAGGSGSGGSSGSGSTTFGPQTISVSETVQNVKKVRVTVSNSGSFHNENGNHSWDLRIYEVTADAAAGGFAAII